ncbi:protein of unknown function [Enterobacter cancerogenus]|nr:protein of unknown function [Enterobacter cancerogenus]
MTLFARNWEKCQPNLTDPDAYEQQLQQKCKGLALRFVEPWLLAFVHTDAKQGRCQPVMVCYALLGKTRGKVSTATASENFRYTNSGRGGGKHSPFAIILEPLSDRCSGLPGRWRSG